MMSLQERRFLEVPKRLAAIGMIEINPRKSEPTVARRINRRETYFSVPLPGRTDGIYEPCF